MNTRSIAIIAIATVAALLIATAAVSASSDQAFAHHKRQTLNQANVCGNNNFGAQISQCQNAASQNQGNGNSVNVIATQ